MNTRDYVALKGDEVTSEEEKRLTKMGRRAAQWEINARLCPNLLRTCKQVYREGTSILYGHNAFQFLMIHDLVHFSRDCARQLRHVRVVHLASVNDYKLEDQADHFRVLERFTRLKAIILTSGFFTTLCRRHRLGSGADVARRFFALAGSWCWNYAVRKGRKKAIFDILFFPPEFGGAYKEETQHAGQFLKWRARFPGEIEDHEEFEKEFRETIMFECMR